MTERKTLCSSCEAPIFWAKTVNGRAIPIDLESCGDDGNIEVLFGSDGSVTANVVGKQRGLFPALRYKSHFATCPNAADHRKDR